MISPSKTVHVQGLVLELSRSRSGCAGSLLAVPPASGLKMTGLAPGHGGTDEVEYGLTWVAVETLDYLTSGATGFDKLPRWRDFYEVSRGCEAFESAPQET